MSRRRKRVFILGGGAALGAHQVGAIKRLEEEGITPDAIVGSSVGVVNACLYASGGVENMARAWESFPSAASVFRPSLRHNPVAGLSLFSMEPLAASIEKWIDFRKLHETPLELSFILLNLSRGEGQFFSNFHATSPEELRALARAGYAIPGLFPPVRFRGELFVDGGFAWNVPLLQAVEMGATEIYVLSVVSTTLPFENHFRSFSQYMVRVSDVLWRTLANVGFVTTRIEDDGTYRGVPVTVVQPTEEHSGFSLRTVFSTTRERSLRLVDVGYRDARRELERLRRLERGGVVARGPLMEVEPAFRHGVR